MTSTTRKSPANKRLRTLLATLALPLAVSACESIKEDDFQVQGGISPDPTAIIEGSILYIGPRPTCLRKPDGSFDRIRGNVVLTMFEYSNPPPPEGTATSAINLFFKSGDDVFDETDCLPDGAPPNYDDRIAKSVAFVWPRVPLEVARAVDYQIRGFFDYDEDMIPLFSVTRLPTQGDIAGAAVNDVQDSSKGFLRISLPKLTDAPNGVLKKGVAIALANPVWTERPAFRLDANRRLAADAPFIPGIKVNADGSLAADGPLSLRNFRALTCASGGTDGTACGLTLQRLNADDAPKLAARSVGLDIASNSSYAFYAQPVDVKTVVLKAPEDTSAAGGLDLARADGVADPHPFLGSGLGIPWYSPIVLMQRLADPARADIEARARIPRVLLVGSVLMGDDNLPTKKSYVQSGAPIAIPPVAAVELITNRNDCRVPYFPPGTFTQATDGRLANCDELPTGRYSVNVLGGIAGGRPAASPDFPARAESPIAITGGVYSSQSWSIPNELGDVAQVGDANLVADQGLAGTFVIHDPSPEKTACTPSTVQGVCTAGPEIIENPLGVDSTFCLPADCCANVVHLCGLPLCAKVPTADGNIAASPTTITGSAPNGAGIPDCVPFELPWQCCRAAP